MEHCPHRPFALRVLLVAALVLVGSQFALQVRNGDLLVATSAQPASSHFLADAFPTAEASVVVGR